MSSNSENKTTVLFLCTGNSCRSQMAEGWTRQLLSDRVAACSAGIVAHGLNPNAVRVMAEAGVDISEQESTCLSDIDATNVDLVVTVCDNARESCPVFPGNAQRAHRAFDDPPRLAEDAAGEDEALAHYRRVRDEIRAFVEKELPAILKDTNAR